MKQDTDAREVRTQSDLRRPDQDAEVERLAAFIVDACERLIGQLHGLREHEPRSDGSRTGHDQWLTSIAAAERSYGLEVADRLEDLYAMAGAIEGRMEKGPDPLLAPEVVRAVRDTLRRGVSDLTQEALVSLVRSTG